jgi:hypothetical protein
MTRQKGRFVFFVFVALFSTVYYTGKGSARARALCSFFTFQGLHVQLLIIPTTTTNNTSTATLLLEIACGARARAIMCRVGLRIRGLRLNFVRLLDVTKRTIGQ